MLVTRVTGPAAGCLYSDIVIAGDVKLQSRCVVVGPERRGGKIAVAICLSTSILLVLNISSKDHRERDR